MTRAWATIRHERWWHVKHNWRSIFTRKFWFWMPRPGYCMRCGDWCWLTNERPAYSAYDGAFICEECAVYNDEATAEAWRDYYAGGL